MKVSDLKLQLDLMPEDADIAIKCGTDDKGDVTIEKNFRIFQVVGANTFVLAFDENKTKINIVEGECN